MALTEAKLKANQKYRKKFEYLQARVTTEYKEAVIHHTEKTGESLNAFIHRAISETIERDQQK